MSDEPTQRPADEPATEPAGAEHALPATPPVPPPLPPAPEPGLAPPPPGPVFVPAGLGLPAGYYTPAPPAGPRPRVQSVVRRRVPLLVAAGALVLGLLVGGAVGAGAALVAGDHHEHSGTSQAEQVGADESGHDRGGR